MTYIKVFLDGKYLTAERHGAPRWLKVGEEGFLVNCLEKDASGILSLDCSIAYQLKGRELLGLTTAHEAEIITKEEYDALGIPEPEIPPEILPPYPPKSQLAAELLTMQINSFSLTDKQALHFAPLYPAFESLIGQRKKQGYRFTYDGVLYSVAQPELTFEKHRPPGEGTESLYERVDNMHEGTLDDPIPAALNMKYFKDKYYIENDVIYLCVRDSEQPLQHLPSELLGQYFEKI